MSSVTEMSVQPPAGFSEKIFEDFLSSRNDPGWVVELRRTAFEKYCELLQSELDPEEWGRIDLRLFQPDQYKIIEGSDSTDQFGSMLLERGEFGGHITHVDGKSQKSELSEELKSQGVIFGDLSELVHEQQELLQPYFMKKAVKYDTDRFSAWHAAFWTSGTVLYVPRNVEVKVPLHSLVAMASEGASDFSHTLVILEEGSSATLLEETVSANSDTNGLHVGAVELIVEAGAKLRYVQLQNWNEKVWHFAHQCGRVAKDAFLQWTIGGLGSRLAHIHQDVMLDGRGAEAEVNGVTFAVDDQVISFYTQQSHNAPDTRSDLLYKEVLRDNSRVIWRGMIRVEPEAQKTDGYQRSDALLLSKTCRNDSIPGLEIEADDVRCTHGATAGRVDEEQIFYCMGRGLNKYEAMHMIVEGFFQRVFDRIPVEIVRDTLSQAVEKKLQLGD